MFDPMTDRKVQLCQVAAQMAADGSMPPCAAARLAVAQEYRRKAQELRVAASYADRAVYMRRDKAHADELDQAAAKLEFEAKSCTATG
jgi:hypothetical protein